MRYYATASGPKVRDAMRCGLIGQIETPRSGHLIEPGVDWIADNGIFGDTYPGDDAYLDWLAERPADRAVFAVAPDVVGDAAGTLDRSGPMLPRIRRLGYPVALAAQNGLETMAVPWRDFDVLFLGGDTDWKLGPYARRLAADARVHGKSVHMGRVNSRRRIRYAAQMGCRSADGTYLAHGPDVNLPKVLGWVRELDRQLALFATPDGDQPPAVTQ